MRSAPTADEMQHSGAYIEAAAWKADTQHKSVGVTLERLVHSYVNGSKLGTDPRARVATSPLRCKPGVGFPAASPFAARHRAYIEAAAWKDTQRGIMRTSEIQPQIGRYVTKGNAQDNPKHGYS